MVIILHGRCCSTGSDGTQSGHITEHLCQRNHGFHDTGTATSLFHSLNKTTTLVQVADNITHVLFRSNYLYLHNRLHQHRACLWAKYSECLMSHQLERQLIGVYRVEATIGQRHLHTGHWETTKDSVTQTVCKAFLH